MRNTLRGSICIAALLCVTPVLPADSSAAQLSLYTDPQGSSCFFDHPPLMETTPVYLLLKFSAGHTAAAFSLSLPSPSAYTIASWSVPSPFLSFGDPASGIEIAFMGCVSGDALVLRLDLMRIADPTSDCLSLRLHAHPSQLAPILIDCATPEGQSVYIDESLLWIQGEDGCAPMPEPSNPSPSDGATNVPTAVTLDCVLHDDDVEFSECVPLHTGRWVKVYLGTDQNPPLALPDGQFPMPRTLAPGTTYYWRVEHRYGPARALSPLWSFTTATSTPVSASTCGKIKALYR